MATLRSILSINKCSGQMVTPGVAQTGMTNGGAIDISFPGLAMLRPLRIIQMPTLTRTIPTAFGQPVF